MLAVRGLAVEVSRVIDRLADPSGLYGLLAPDVYARSKQPLQQFHCVCFNISIATRSQEKRAVGELVQREEGERKILERSRDVDTVKGVAGGIVKDGRQAALEVNQTGDRPRKIHGGVIAGAVAPHREIQQRQQDEAAITLP